MSARIPVSARIVAPIVAKVVAVSLFVAAAGAGCSVLVTGDVDEISCTGNLASSCPAGLSCDAVTGRCVVPVDAAPAEDVTVEDTGDVPEEDATVDAAEDAIAPPFALGLPCRIGDDCKSGLCGTSTMLTQPILDGTGPICTKTCCTSADCDDGFVCFGGGTGGNYCVPAAKAERTPPSSGGKAPGNTCSTNSACRSGACVAGRCLDTCCLATDCKAGTLCQVANVEGPGPSHDTWVCAPENANATKNVGDTCFNEPNECKNNNCIGGGSGVCRPSCCSMKDCWSQGLSDGHCRYADSGNDQIKFCTSTTIGNVNDGQNCTFDSDCKSAYCDPELKKCAQVCCQDRDCSKSGEVCRPSGTGTPFLRCVSGVR